MTETKYFTGYDPVTNTHQRTVIYGFEDGTIMRKHMGGMTASSLEADVRYHAIQESKNGGMRIYSDPKRPVASDILSKLQEVYERTLSWLEQSVAATA